MRKNRKRAKLKAIQEAIEQLPAEQQTILASWLSERDWKARDEQIERDFSAGGRGTGDCRGQDSPNGALLNGANPASEVSVSNFRPVLAGYDKLPAKVQDHVDKQYALFDSDPFHPSMVGKGIDSANEWPPVCECKYDEIQNKVDREDCLLYGSMEEKISPPLENRIALKKPATIAKLGTESAA